MHIHIFWDSLSPPGLQVPVTRTISAIMGVPATVSENQVRIMGYVNERRQIDAQVLLESIRTYKHRHALTDPLLLVVHQDLFKNGNRFVFGLARETPAAVISRPGSNDIMAGRE
jgi:archaemetzincin